MPYTRLQEKARKKYVKPRQFAEQYDISKSQLYRILNMQEFQEAIIKVGAKTKRINVDRAFEIMQQVFR